MMRNVIMGGSVVGALVVLGAIGGSFYTVPEGHVGIVTSFGKAVKQVEPGLHMKVPYIQGVVEVETREKRNTETFNASTRDELPIATTVSVNWIVDGENDGALQMYRQYGSLDQFEDRVIDPLLSQAVKAAVSRFSASELIQDRSKAAAEIAQELQLVMNRVPANVKSPQIENVKLPQSYLEAVQRKEEARQETNAERERLARQKLEAQRDVQTAEAAAQAERARADAKAYVTETESVAEAEAIKRLGDAQAAALMAAGKALKDNPLVVQLEQMKRWDGTLPRMQMGGQPSFLMQLPAEAQ